MLDQDPCLLPPRILAVNCEQVRLLKDPPRLVYPQGWRIICTDMARKIGALSHLFLLAGPSSPRYASYPRFLWITMCNSQAKPLDNLLQPGSCARDDWRKKSNSFKIIAIDDNPQSCPPCAQPGKDRL